MSYIKKKKNKTLALKKNVHKLAGQSNVHCELKRKLLKTMEAVENIEIIHLVIIFYRQWSQRLTHCI